MKTLDTAWPGPLTRFLKRRVLARLAGLRHGRVTLVDGGTRVVLGDEDADLHAAIHVNDPRFWSAVAFSGSVGAGAAYAEGRWDCDDLTALVRILVRNREVLDGSDVVAIDVLGHGVTRAAPPDPMTFQAGADWLVAALDALALGPVQLVAHSYGGEFAWRAALDRPDLVDRLVLIDSSGIPRPPDGFLPEEVKMREWSIATLGWIVNSRDRIRVALAPHVESVDDAWLEELFLVCENAANWRATVELCRDENGTRAGELERLSVPTLLLWGENDLAYPVDAFAREFEARIPDARLVVFEGTGHYPNEARPREVVAAIEAFMDEEPR